VSGGTAVGAVVGIALGVRVGGTAVGAVVGRALGVRVGGTAVGAVVGRALGTATTVGSCVAVDVDIVVAVGGGVRVPVAVGVPLCATPIDAKRGVLVAPATPTEPPAVLVMFPPAAIPSTMPSTIPTRYSASGTPGGSRRAIRRKSLYRRSMLVYPRTCSIPCHLVQTQGLYGGIGGDEINQRAARVRSDSTAANSETSLQTDRLNVHEEAVDPGALSSL
jgi:hypothetical protein